MPTWIRGGAILGCCRTRIKAAALWSGGLNWMTAKRGHDRCDVADFPIGTLGIGAGFGKCRLGEVLRGYHHHLVGPWSFCGNSDNHRSFAILRISDRIIVDGRTIGRLTASLFHFLQGKWWTIGKNVLYLQQLFCLPAIQMSQITHFNIT